jgi:ASPIC and UnbV
VHFGLGQDKEAKLVRIEWPSGAVQELRDVRADQVLAVEEPK